MSAEELAGVQTPCAHHVRTSYGVDEAPREIARTAVSPTLMRSMLAHSAKLSSSHL
jgi:hypothetical protein